MSDTAISATARIQPANGAPVVDFTVPGYEGPVSVTLLEWEALYLAAELTRAVFDRQRSAQIAEHTRAERFAMHGYYPEDTDQ
ncbi:MAG: hypothetical protein GX859_03390 [Corynebacterium humireducens]|jgi:hypothetical protein|uniref:Uncharacterized protein n=1 Tax=Corynebacterium humireducens TaxID=1223514 RepID=A0A7X6PMG7_9CORY|nr:hypothetical protein [Corynebacterium humireducens]